LNGLDPKATVSTISHIAKEFHSEYGYIALFYTPVFGVHQKLILQTFPEDKLMNQDIFSGMFIGKNGSNVKKIMDKCQEHDRDRLHIMVKNANEPFAFNILVCANDP